MSQSVSPKYRFIEADYNIINQEISRINWVDILSGLSAKDSVETFYETIYHIIFDHVPLRPHRSNEYPIWFTRPLIHIFKNKNNSWSKWKKYKNISDYEQFSMYRRRFKLLAKECFNTYLYSVEEGLRKDLKVNQKVVDFSTEVGEKLGKALVLPEKVQKFAICREILMTHNNKHIYESVYPFTNLFFAYNLSYYLNHKLNLYSAPLALRITQYAIVGMLSLGIYFLMKDLTEVYYETQVDKKLCQLGVDFIESGIIFYDKLLQRNQALRHLMGNEGEKKYSVNGNEIFFIRQPRIALYHRKQFFEEQLKNAHNINDDLKANDVE
ncbi:hypothetical protein ACJJTC_015761 [Scirpophaga incertulas]